MFLNTCHRQNTQFVLQNVINLYAGYIGNRKYVSLNHRELLNLARFGW